MSGRMVVGVDGSETSRMATRWAAREAGMRGTDLELVSAWEIPTYDFGLGLTASSDDLTKGLIKVAEDNLAAALEEARAEVRELKIETRIVEGQAARVLLDASKGADLLVVGSRGLGGFRELLLGSVSQQCADHAGCPVVIVRHPREEPNSTPNIP
jgi:nucleotide-binding universal stress UspA family protein